MSSDVLSVTVLIGAQYASVNHVGAGSHRGGTKSPAYKRLFADVKAAAEAEIARTGWTTASCECFVTIVRYVGDRRRHDAMNLGKCEMDALTAAEVWHDDCLANPCLPWIRYDAEGGHRVTIVIVKLFASTCNAPTPVPRARTETTRRVSTANPCVHRGGQIPEGYAALNGKLVPREVALRKAGIA
jgi:Holliday junction resolvase RusA-like endonuclease